MEARTIESILTWFRDKIENKLPITPAQWLEAGQYLNILSEDIDEDIADLEMKLAQSRVELIESGDSVAKAKLKVESLEEYRELRLKKAEKERVVEHIRLAKYWSRISLDNEKGIK